MAETAEKKAGPRAWEPLTPRGVAAFARATLGRLLMVQLVVALVGAATVVWFLHWAWFPVISEAVQALPDRGQISSGTLAWPLSSPRVLAENRFLALVVDLKHEAKARTLAHVQVELGASDLKIISLFGFSLVEYPRDKVFPTNRGELEPRWGAWAPAVLGISAAATVIALLLSWALLATIYFLPAWLLGFYSDRDLRLGGSWRLAGAALMPGALFMMAMILFYGLGLLDPIHLLAAWAVHILIGWFYVGSSQRYLQRHVEAVASGGNPFRTAGAAAKSQATE